MVIDDYPVDNFLAANYDSSLFNTKIIIYFQEVLKVKNLNDCHLSLFSYILIY